jgi:hypothetical protein
VGERAPSHTSGSILLHLISSTAGHLPMIEPAFRNDLLVSWRHRGWNAGDSLNRQRHIRSCSCAGSCSAGQSAVELARIIGANSSGWVRLKWNANFAWQTGIRCIQRQGIERHNHHKIYCRPGRALQEAVELFSLRGSESTATAAVMKRYVDIRSQLADAALVYLAEREGRRHHVHVGSARFFGLPLGAQASLPHFA